MNLTPTEDLLAGRRALDALAGSVAIIQDWTWCSEVGRWTLACQICSSQGHSSNWYILAEASYPFGEIDFYPAEIGGIEQTYPHQNHNGWPEAGFLWRKGKICLDSSVSSLGRIGGEREPFNSHERLLWYCQRAIAWITAAEGGTLTKPGDPFELPHFPHRETSLVAFSETPQNLPLWQELTCRAGICELSKVKQNPRILVVQKFLADDGSKIHESHWGSCLKTLGDQVRARVWGLWLRLDKVPVLPPWEAPTKWEQLREIAESQGFDLDQLLMTGLACRRRHTLELILIGFPIPQIAGGQLVQMHWQPIMLSSIRPPKSGFGGQRNLKLHHEKIFEMQKRIRWGTCQNWDASEISNRGRLPLAVRSQSIGLIGAGALGGALANLLVRAGNYALTLCEFDVVQIGNLVRSNYSLLEIGESKAQALRLQLLQASPHSAVKIINESFPPCSPENIDCIKACDVILDCTAEDSVLQQLESFSWQAEKLFVSISLGFKAKRLFCYGVRSKCFPVEDFHARLEPWLERESQEYTLEDFPHDGVGCWHPVFPARLDDVTLMAAIAIKFIEQLIVDMSTELTFAVYTAQYEGETFAGIKSESIK
jgi:ThiF family